MPKDLNKYKSCVGGTLNRIIEALNMIHPDVEVSIGQGALANMEDYLKRINAAKVKAFGAVLSEEGSIVDLYLKTYSLEYLKVISTELTKLKDLEEFDNTNTNKSDTLKEFEKKLQEYILQKAQDSLNIDDVNQIANELVPFIKAIIEYSLLEKVDKAINELQKDETKKTIETTAADVENLAERGSLANMEFHLKEEEKVAEISAKIKKIRVELTAENGIIDSYLKDYSLENLQSILSELKDLKNTGNINKGAKLEELETKLKKYILEELNPYLKIEDATKVNTENVNKVETKLDAFIKKVLTEDSLLEKVQMAVNAFQGEITKTIEQQEKASEDKKIEIYTELLKALTDHDLLKVQGLLPKYIPDQETQEQKIDDLYAIETNLQSFEDILAFFKQVMTMNKGLFAMFFIKKHQHDERLKNIAGNSNDRQFGIFIELFRIALETKCDIQDDVDRKIKLGFLFDISNLSFTKACIKRQPTLLLDIIAMLTQKEFCEKFCTEFSVDELRSYVKSFNDFKHIISALDQNIGLDKLKQQFIDSFKPDELLEIITDLDHVIEAIKLFPNMKDKLKEKCQNILTVPNLVNKIKKLPKKIDKFEFLISVQGLFNYQSMHIRDIIKIIKCINISQLSAFVKSVPLKVDINLLLPKLFNRCFKGKFQPIRAQKALNLLIKNLTLEAQRSQKTGEEIEKDKHELLNNLLDKLQSLEQVINFIKTIMVIDYVKLFPNYFNKISDKLIEKHKIPDVPNTPQEQQFIHLWEIANNPTKWSDRKANNRTTKNSKNKMQDELSKLGSEYRSEYRSEYINSSTFVKDNSSGLSSSVLPKNNQDTSQNIYRKK